MPYKDPEKAKAAKRVYWERNKEKHRALVRERNRRVFAAMTEDERRAFWAREKAKQRQNKESNERIKASHKKWRNGEKGAAYRARPDVKKMQCEATEKYREQNWDKVLEYTRKKRATNPKVKLVSALRTRTIAFLKGSKNKKTMEYVGCTLEHLRTHLESQFTEGMHWGNHGKGRGKWQVDHIYPLSQIDPTNEDLVRRALHWKNLRPMWAIENISKGKNVICELPPLESPCLPATAG